MHRLACGVRSRATSSSGADASSPDTTAPRSAALLDRGEAHAALLFRGDADDVLGTAGAFAQAGYPYQQTRTLALAAVPPSAPKMTICR